MRSQAVAARYPQRGKAFFLLLSLALHAAILLALPQESAPPVKRVPCQVVFIDQAQRPSGAPLFEMPVADSSAAAPVPKGPPLPDVMQSKSEPPEPVQPREKNPSVAKVAPAVPVEKIPLHQDPAPDRETRLPKPVAAAPVIAPPVISPAAGDGESELSEAVVGAGDSAAPASSIFARFGEGGGPRVLEMPQPRYPLRAKRLRLEGQVLLLLDLDHAGSLRSAEVLEPGGHGFDEAALTAVNKALFLPAVRDGVQVACRALLPVSFRLRSAR